MPSLADIVKIFRDVILTMRCTSMMVSISDEIIKIFFMLIIGLINLIDFKDPSKFLVLSWKLTSQSVLMNANQIRPL